MIYGKEFFMFFYISHKENLHNKKAEFFHPENGREKKTSLNMEKTLCFLFCAFIRNIGAGLAGFLSEKAIFSM